MEKTERPGEKGSESAYSGWEPDYYVGIGASAGGLEAIEAFIKKVQPGSGLAYIVVQHLSPDYKSLMVELLSKRTNMPVYRAEEGMVVEADSVYLIPPKKNLTIFHGKLLLKDQDFSRGLNLPIDVFLRSLAEDQGPRAIAIILSGTGSDGMRGIRAVKEQGGMVMVQDEDSAKFDGMPRSAISTGLVDFILPPERMPDKLLSYIKHPYVSRTERSDSLLTNEDGLTRIFSLLREKSKVDFTYYKPSTVVRRIERRMTVNQIHELGDYVKYLESYPGEVAALYRELLIGVTSFFRDPDAFEELATTWIPELLRRATQREVRFWVAGCSTGEEAYTLAILCRESMERMNKAVDVKIFATDIDQDAIQRASGGEYPESIAADLSPQLLSKHFNRKSDIFQVNHGIREMVVFARHNIIKDPPFTNIDLLSCRNLLIYLQAVLQKKVLELFNFSLNPHGILLLGTSETTGELSEFFEPVHHKWKIYRSKGKRKPKIADDLIMNFPQRLYKPERDYRAGGPRSMKAYEEERALDRLLQALSGDYVPLVVIVNEDQEILYVAGNTEGFFRLPEGKMDNDVSKMAAKDLAIPLATGLQKVFKTGEEVGFTNIRIKNNGAEKKVHMRIRSLPPKKGQHPLAAVLLEDAGFKEALPAHEIRTFDVGKEAEQRILDLEQELQFTKENLQATIEELETSNEELQATNEELLASNEELQSTNEELQSVNEELYTVNAEYQSKIVELTELNNDMDNLLTSTEIGTLFLDEDLEIRKFTHKIQEVYKIRESDIGRPISHLNHRLADVDPFEMFEEVHESGRPMEHEVQAESGKAYLMRVLPYKIGPQSFAGVVITFIEITRVKEAQKALGRSESQLRHMARLAKVGSWEYVPETGEHRWDEEVYRIHELAVGDQPTPEKAIQYYVPESRPQMEEAFSEAVEKGVPYDLVFQIWTEKGNRRWVRSVGDPEVRDGRVVKVSGSLQDVTTLKTVEEDLRHERDLVARIMDTSPACITMVDRNGHIVYANARAEDLFGLKKDDIRGRRYNSPDWKITDYEGNPFPEEELPFEVVRRTGRAVYSIEHAVEDSDGKRILLSINASPLLDEKGAFDGMVSIVEDVTGRILAEQRARQSEKRYRELFDRMLNAFALHEIVTDEDGKPVDYVFLEVNKAFEEMTGLSGEDILGRRVTEVIPDIVKSGFDWIGEYGKVALGGGAIRFESYLEATNRCYSVSAYSPSKNRFAVLFDDITEKKIGEDARERRDCGREGAVHPSGDEARKGGD